MTMLRTTSVLGLLLFILSSTVRAQNTAPAPKWYDQITVNGLVSGSYTYNFNKPDDRINRYRIFDIDHNSLEFDLAELVIQHDPAVAEAGFRLDVTAGPHLPSLTHASGLEMHDLDLQQAYISYIASVGSGLRFDLGKFVTLPGYELIDGYDGFNENASRSFLFGYAVPFTNTGLKVSYSFGDLISATAMITNGWDNVVDNNFAKTIGLQLKITPIPEVNVALTGLTGPERSNDDSSRRSIIDLSSTLMITDNVSIGISADYGSERFANLRVDQTSDSVELRSHSDMAVWQGVAGYLRVKPSDRFAVTIRAEVFDDVDATRTGKPQTLREFTLTPEFHVTNSLLLRSDIRLDQSTLPVFLDSYLPSRSQVTASLNAILTF